MEPNEQQPPNQPELDEEAARIARATDDLQAKLLEPLPPSVPAAPRSLNLSEMEALRDLMQTLVQRVDQVARTSAEQFSRVEQVIEQMIATMRLAQEMIARQDELQVAQGDQIDRQEAQVAALIKINANLSEIVAALTGPNNSNQGG